MSKLKERIFVTFTHGPTTPLYNGSNISIRLIRISNARKQAIQIQFKAFQIQFKQFFAATAKDLRALGLSIKCALPVNKDTIALLSAKGLTGREDIISNAKSCKRDCRVF